MSNLVNKISQVTSSIDAKVDVARGKVAKLLGVEDPYRVLPYRGYGTADKFFIKGRVVKDEGIRLREQESSLTNNVWNMYKRFATDEVSDARLRIQFEQTEEYVTTNQEGFFNLEVYPEHPQEDYDFWCSVDVSLVEPEPKGDAVLGQAEVMLVPEQANFGVISDIDDTIVHTAATDVLKMIRIVYLGSAKSRKPFAGVPEFYNALQQGTNNHRCNPIFYVSSSAWNMYDVFSHFMELNDIPKGPIFLKDIELSLENLMSFNHESHKLEQIKPIFQRFPQLPFILIGDSGQKDPEIYKGLVKENPEKILGIFIRDAVPNDGWRKQELQAIAEEVRSLGSEFYLFEETQQAMDFAQQKEWIL